MKSMTIMKTMTMEEANKEMTREELLDVLASYHRMIERDNWTYPTYVLGDIFHSIKYVLARNHYYGK